MSKKNKTFNKKRVMCGMLAALLAVCPMQLSAAERTNQTASQPVMEIEVSLRDSSVVTNAVSVNASVSEASYAVSTLSGVNFGDQIVLLGELTDTERADCKAVYDAMTKMTPDSGVITVTLPVSYVVSPENAQEASIFLTRICQTAADAYLRDYPENYWLNLNEMTPGASLNITFVDGAMMYEVSAVTITAAVSDSYVPEGEYRERFDKAVQEMTVDQTDRYQIVKSIHDTICLSNVYIEDTYAHDSYAGLVTGKSVCEGYAKAFKVMCDKYGVPCVLVSGDGINSKGEQEAHMWNYVQMEDGSWYGVDVTWDDSGTDQIYYDYFLAGADTAAPHYGSGKMTFAESHVANGDFNKAGIAVFTYPALSSAAYPYDSQEPTPEPVETGAPDETEEPPVEPIVYGDLNGNRTVEAADALAVLKNVVGLSDFDEAQMEAADVDGENGVNATDALIILRRVVGLIEKFPVEDQSM